MKNQIDWKKIQDNYSINKEMIWLNNAGTTSIGLEQKSFITQYFEEYSKYGIFSPNYSYPKVKSEILGILSKLINCNSDNLALIHNTSEGMNLISQGLSLEKGDTIFILENEYPSNYYPWEHWKTKGIKILAIPMQNSPYEYLETIFNLIQSSKPKLISLSPVHWCTGITLPMEEIALLCQEHNIRLVLDGAQTVGHLDIKLEEWGVYAMAFSAWKWLLGPLGLAVIYVSNSALKELNPVFKGVQSVVGDSEYLPYKSEIKATADRYEYSTPSIVDWIYFLGSLRFLGQIGFDHVKARIYNLTSILYDGIISKGYTTTRDSCTEIKSGILAINPKRDQDIEMIANSLKEKNIICAVRMGRLRFSPHIYLSEEQLKIAIEALP